MPPLFSVTVGGCSVIPWTEQISSLPPLSVPISSPPLTPMSHPSYAEILVLVYLLSHLVAPLPVAAEKQRGVCFPDLPRWLDLCWLCGLLGRAG